MRLAIQLVETFSLRASASEALDHLKTQDGFLGGRVLSPSEVYVDWRVQAFFQDDADAHPESIGSINDWLPDGCRRVVIPDGIAKALGILG